MKRTTTSKWDIIIRLLAAENHGQIDEIVDAYGKIILLDNFLSNYLRDARVRVERMENKYASAWKEYELN